MAFELIEPEEIDADSPMTETLWTKVKNSLDFLFANMVTNGNAHNHVGGDGAVIPISDGLDLTVQSDGSQAIAALATWVPTSGAYQVVGDIGSAGQLKFEMLISATWRRHAGEVADLGIMFADGTNMRVKNYDGSVTATLYFQKF